VLQQYLDAKIIVLLSYPYISNKAKYEWPIFVYIIDNCKTNFKHTKIDSSNHWQDKTKYAWEHFQDYLNVIVHEDNSPYNFFDTLVKIFKAFHILDQGAFGNKNDL
jgi:hypothetical protein